jgi:hypothetical protein
VLNRGAAVREFRLRASRAQLPHAIHRKGGRPLNSTSYDPSDTIADGLAVFVLSTDDYSVTESGAAAYRRVYRTVRQQMRPGDTCRLALPSTIVTPDLRKACFVIVLQDRVLVAYERGLFRSKTESLVIPIPTVAEIRQHTGSTAGLRGVSLLTICGEPSVTIALPAGTAGRAAGIIREILQPTVD